MTAALQRLWTNPRQVKRLIMLFNLLAGAVLVWGSRGLIALDWQRMYRPEEFRSLGDLWGFLGELQTGISPIWSSLEILAQLAFGSTALFSHFFYPATLLLLGILPTWLFARTSLQALLTAGLSLFFILVTRILHQGNPQLYDLYFPALLLGLLGMMGHLQGREGQPGKLWRSAMAAGLLLAVLELTRTFAIVLAPFLLLGFFLVLRRLPKTYFLFFLLPVALLSGGWHAKQMAAHGHFHWTNHSGFNLHKSWAEFAGPIDYKEAPPRYEGGFPNINTDEHSRYDKEVRRKVLAGIARRPCGAFAHAMERLLAFYRPKTDLYLSTLPTWLEYLYRPVVWSLGLLLAFLTGRLAWQIFRRPLKLNSWERLGDASNMLLLTAALTSLLFAIGESGEEARFMISILPLLACLPAIALQAWGEGASWR